MYKRQAPSKTYLDSVTRQLAGLREALDKGRPITPLSDVSTKVEAFRSGAEAGYAPFSSRVVTALAERLAVLAAYRRFARDLRNEAGLELSHFPEAADVCESMRALAGQTLRKRYYLETDWRGEQPLGGPEVSYEEIADR